MTTNDRNNTFMTTPKIILIAGAAGIFWYAVARATDGTDPATSCCSAMASCTGMAGAQANASAATAVDSTALTVPVKSVYDHYLKIQAALASDSLAGVAENAGAIAKAVQGDAKLFPAEAGKPAEALAKAKDLGAARAAFKPLSDTLIKYLSDNKAKDAYVQVYCPMARANWLQADKNVNNPYFGSAMSGCGEIKE
jgi:hypothetical protein